jgi:hypothetical protein
LLKIVVLLLANVNSVLDHTCLNLFESKLPLLARNENEPAQTENEAHPERVF